MLEVSQNVHSFLGTLSCHLSTWLLCCLGLGTHSATASSYRIIGQSAAICWLAPAAEPSTMVQLPAPEALLCIGFVVHLFSHQTTDGVFAVSNIPIPFKGTMGRLHASWDVVLTYSKPYEDVMTHWWGKTIQRRHGRRGRQTLGK